MPIRSPSVRGLVAVSSIALSSTADAQNAVQWRIEDGGNGHWYGTTVVSISDATFWERQDAAVALGGHLPTIANAAENAFVRSTIGGGLGLYHVPGGSWRNVTDEPVTYFNWQPGQPSSLDQFVFAAYCCHPSDSWADFTDAELGNPNDPLTGFAIEFDADCNADGIVDYGQILAGEFADANGNNIPDCCENGVPCDPCAAVDLDASGAVNGIDLAIILNTWGTDGGKYPQADVDGDGVVGGTDLALILGAWGECP
jgi:hypothetical protein